MIIPGVLNPDEADTGLWIKPVEYERKTGLPEAKSDGFDFPNTKLKTGT